MPQSFESRSAASKKGWAKRKSSKAYYSPQQIQSRREASRKAAATRYGREYVPEEITEYINRSDVVIQNMTSEINRVTFDMFKSELDSYDSSSLNVSTTLQGIKQRDYLTIKNIFDGAIARDGEDAVAMRIEAAGEDIINALISVLYDSGDKAKISQKEEFQAKVNEISRILNGSALSIPESYRVTNFSEALNEGE
jgi:hypothetical protein